MSTYIYIKNIQYTYNIFIINEFCSEGLLFYDFSAGYEVGKYLFICLIIHSCLFIHLFTYLFVYDLFIHVSIDLSLLLLYIYACSFDEFV